MGTEELRYRRALGLTQEPLDLCLRHELITPEQHAAGIHLRWLFTVCFGVPQARSLDLMENRSSPRETTEEWLKKREQDYTSAVKLFTARAMKKTVLDCCVYGKQPEFVTVVPGKHRPRIKILKNHQTLRLLREGLILLEKAFRLSGKVRLSRKPRLDIPNSSVFN